MNKKLILKISYIYLGNFSLSDLHENKIIMASSTLVFSKQIESIFGDLINDGRIVCPESVFKEKIAELQKMIKSSSKPKKTSTRKPSNFMKWLSSDKRTEIKDEFFGDFEEHKDWSVDGIIEYYNKKFLPTDKLNELIKKKQDDGKEIKKPRLMALITTKAGIIWKSMTDEEKQVFNTTPSDDDSEKKSKDDDSDSTKSTKKGRPAGYKAKTFASDNTVNNTIKNVEEGVNSGDDNSDTVELDMFTYEGKELFKDDSNNVYNDDCELIGTINDDGIVTFN